MRKHTWPDKLSNRQSLKCLQIESQTKFKLGVETSYDNFFFIKNDLKSSQEKKSYIKKMKQNILILRGFESWSGSKKRLDKKKWKGISRSFDHKRGLASEEKKQAPWKKI